MFLKNRLQPLKNLQLSFNVCKSESRLFKHCNSLLKFGLFDEVEVVGYTEDRVEEIENFSKHLLLRRFPLFFRNTKSNALKIVNVVIWTFQLLWVKRQTKYHTITIHSVIILPTGCLFKLFYKTRLVYDAHEHETESNGLSGIKKKIYKTIEKKLIKYCDVVILVGDFIANDYKKMYPVLQPYVIKNTPHYNYLDSKTTYYRDELKIKKASVIFLYQGIFAEGRGTLDLLKIFESFKDDSRVIVFMGYGDLENLVKETAQKSPNVFYYPAVAYHQIMNYTSSADIGISYIENSSLSYYYCLPNKFFEYIMSGLPLLVSNSPEMKQIVEAFNIGIVTPDFSYDSLKKTILSVTRKQITEWSIRTKEAAQKYNWENQEKKLLELYSSLN